MRTWLCGVAVIGFLVGSPAAAQDRFTGDLCGNKVDVVMKAPGTDAHPELKKFYGVWGNGAWSSGTCNALIVSEVNPTSATIHYIYGTGPEVPNPGSFVKNDAAMKGKQLYFKSKLGSDVYYELVGGSSLKGWFGQNVVTKTNLQRLK